jgi:hypothetical protein
VVYNSLPTGEWPVACAFGFFDVEQAVFIMIVSSGKYINVQGIFINGTTSLKGLQL